MDGVLGGCPKTHLSANSALKKVSKCSFTHVNCAFSTILCLDLTKTWVLGQPPRRLSENADFLQNKAKFSEKVQFTGVNEHFEPNFNAVLEERCVFGQPPRQLAINKLLILLALLSVFFATKKTTKFLRNRRAVYLCMLPLCIRYKVYYSCFFCWINNCQRSTKRMVCLSTCSTNRLK